MYVIIIINIHVLILVEWSVIIETLLFRMSFRSRIAALVSIGIEFVASLLRRDNTNRQEETRPRNNRPEVHHTYPRNNRPQVHYTYSTNSRPEVHHTNPGTTSWQQEVHFAHRQNEACHTQPSWLEDMARIAYSEDHVTHLVTNEGKLYRSQRVRPFLHAEVLFTRDTLPCNIHTIWIKNSPCAKCSKVLITFFHKIRKPKIYFGRIYRLNDEEDREGLINLLQNGFELEVWETLHTLMYPTRSKTTQKYLREVKQEADMMSLNNQVYNYMYY